MGTNSKLATLRFRAVTLACNVISSTLATDGTSMYACAYGAVLVRRSFAVVLQNTPKQEANQNEHPCFRKPPLLSPLQIALHNPTPTCRSWGIWRDPEDVPAYCIDGNIYAPTWQYGDLKETCAQTRTIRHAKKHGVPKILPRSPVCLPQIRRYLARGPRLLPPLRCCYAAQVPSGARGG